MSERISYNQEYQPAATSLEDGTAIDLHASQLGSVEQGKMYAEATRLAESASPEAAPVDEHLQNVRYAMAIGQHTMAMRNMELSATEMN